MKGPTAHARMKMDSDASMAMVLVMCKSRACWDNAGPTMEEFNGEMKLNVETTMVAALFWPLDQFLGCWDRLARPKRPAAPLALMNVNV